MSVLNTLPTPVVQMGLVEKLVDAEQNQPHVQQLAAQQKTQETLKRQDEQVPRVDTARQGKKIRDDEGRRERGRQGRERGGKRQRTTDRGADTGDSENRGYQAGDRADPQDAPLPHDQAAGEAPSSPSSANPWAGNILNIKI